MRTHLAYLIVFSSSLPAFAQVTIYYDDFGNITMKELATHYRVANIDTTAKKFTGNVKDYWYNDSLMLDVTYDASGSRTGAIKVLKANGALRLTGQYLYGIPRGCWHVHGKKTTVVDLDLKRQKPNVVLDSLEKQLSHKDAFSVSPYIRKKDYPEIRSLIFRPRFVPDKSAGFSVAEAQAEFPGGRQALGDFIGALLRYPEEAARNNIKGTVIIGFTISENGELMDFKVIQSLGYGCDEEAIRVLKLLPDWLPGYQSGRNVKSHFSLPIAFQ
jgi:TonB family protein